MLHLLEKIVDVTVTVFLNDSFEIEEINAFDKIIISPGPGMPMQAGKTIEVIKTYENSKSILGVCLGQQAIAVAFGGALINLKEVHHGVSSTVILQKRCKPKENYLFKNMPEKFTVGRYHSWVIDPNYFPKNFSITAVDENGEIMAIEHDNLDIQAVQFHPESIMTKLGEQVMRNWLNL